MRQAIFREFSIRGDADRDLPDEVVYRIGQAVGAYFAADAPPTLVVGRDVRLSSLRISRAIIAGLTDTGGNVLNVGLVPTPTLNFAVDYFKAQGGVMITASHNPPNDNGLKLRAEETLTGTVIQQIYQLAQAGNFLPGSGWVREVDALTPYQNALQSRLNPGKPLTIVVDGGNGANGPLMRNFLRRQGHTVIDCFTDLDGAFPNRNPDPTAENALSAAARLVVEHHADLGLAFDGDGDRVALIDNQGGVYFGDVVLMLLARHFSRHQPIRVVHDVSCTRALTDDVTAHAGQTYPAPVGYAFVHHRMKELGATLGGESAGHIFCLDDQFQFDDAILASVYLLNYIAAEDRPLSDLIADLPQYATSPNYRISCPDDRKSAVIRNIVEHYRLTHPVDTTDGAKIFFEQGWALVRQSNTQPSLSFRVEGKTPADLETIKREVETVINQMNVSQSRLAVIILAAGKGTRMNSDLPKVLHLLKGKPLVAHVLASAGKLNPGRVVLVVGHGAELVQQTIGDGVGYVLQSPQLGTGHAVAQVAPLLANHTGNVLILYGDMPLISAQTLQQLVDLQAENSGPLSMLTVVAENPRGFGRIVRDDTGAVIAIVEEADCTPAQREIKELNVGVYCINAQWLWQTLPHIKISPKGEYYLTDLVALAVSQNQPVCALISTNLIETLGINTPQHLAEAEAALLGH